MPSGPIQTFPVGLLGLLNLKNQGRNPRDLTDVVQPVLDLLSMYLQDNIVSAVNIDAGIGAGITLATSFGPFEDLRWVHNFSVELPLAATDTVNSLYLVLRETAGGITHVISTAAGNITGPDTRFGMYAPGGFWLRPGCELGYAIGCAAGSNVQLEATARFTPVVI